MESSCRIVPLGMVEVIELAGPPAREFGYLSVELVVSHFSSHSLQVQDLMMSLAILSAIWTVFL